jgi:hypothetical protein
MKFIQTTVIRLFLGLLIFSLPATYSAQKSKKDNKKKADKIEIQVTNLRSGAILENGNLRGYYIYQAVDKVYGKQQNYHIELYDENFTALNTLKYKAAMKMVLITSAYSSDELCFMFLNTENQSFDYKVFSVEGKLVSEYSSQLSKKDYRRYMKFVTAERLVSVEGGGFLSTSTVTEKSKISFKVNKFVKGQKKPKEYVFPADKKFNLPTILGIADSTVVLSVRSSKSQLGPAKYHLIGLNQQSMKSKFHLNSDQDGENLFVPYSLIENPEYKTIRISGTYFKPNGNTMKYCKGLAMWEIDPSGVLLSEKYNDWGTDFKNTLSFKGNGKLKKTGFLKVHETFSTSDGKTFAVAEGYRKRYNGWSILTSFFFMPSFLTKYQTTDMVLLEMDKDFKPQAGKVFPKKVTSWAGYGFTTMGVHALSNKIPGMFGYSYAQLNEEKDAFMFTYAEDNFRLTAFKKSNFNFNTVKFENGKYTTDKLTPTSNTWFGSLSNYYMQGQFGKITYLTYDYKTKKSDLQIIKVK